MLTRLIAIGYEPAFIADPKNTARAALGVLGFDLVAIVYGTDFKGLFGQETVPYGVVCRDSRGMVFVAIRGTQTGKEWLEDAWAFPEPWPFDASVKTHKGFTDLFETLVTDEGHNLLEFLGTLGKDIVVTGHSLGAALAALMAAALGSGCGYCETFEGPRVGDLAFCKWMDSRVPNFYRDVIIGDVVPHAPPENLGYFHAGIEIDLDPSGVIPLTLDSKVFLESHHVLSSVQLLLEAPA